MGVHYEEKSMGKPFRGVIVAEGDAAGVYGFDTEAEMNAFASGVSAGAGKYGGDGCGFYTLDDLVENGGEIDPSNRWDKDRYEAVKNALTVAAADCG